MSIRNRFSSLWHGQEGSALPLVGLGLMALIGSAGAAVDMGRLQITQSRMQNALDAAGLAAGATISTTNASATAQQYFNANFQASKFSATVHDFAVTVAPDNSKLNLSVQADVPMVFMKMFGQSTKTLSAKSEVTRASKGMELVLVLDNTGSMNSAVNPANSNTPKLAAMKSAATTLLTTLYGSNETISNLWVGVVPFSQAVNIGTGYASWMDSAYYATLNWGSKPWEGCVMSRPSPYDVTDDLPATKLFQAYNSPSTATGSSSTTTCTGGLNPWKCTRTANGRTTTIYDYGYSSSLGDYKGPNVECPQQVLPMVAEKTTVNNTISALTAAGSTEIPLGMAWAYRMLSPKWRGQWGGEMNTNNLPLDYKTPLMNKVVILMTDGMNSLSSGNYTAYDYLSSNTLGTTKSVTQGYAYAGSAEEALDNRTLQVCNALKANGVIIYTIGFGTVDDNNPNNSTSVNGALLKSCASQDSYYFLAPTNAQLQTAFQQIGDSLANLRISQ